MGRRKRGEFFTLIELLIVVAIIAILAGMLLPALNKAKQKALEIACKNSLKQFSYAYHLYLDNSKEWLPSHRLRQNYYFHMEFKELLYIRYSSIGQNA